MHGSGVTCTFVSFVVPTSGFQFNILTQDDVTASSMGSLRFLFQDYLTEVFFVYEREVVRVYNSDFKLLGDAVFNVIYFKVASDGRVSVIAQTTDAVTVKFPPLASFPNYSIDKIMIKIKLEWTDLVGEITVRFPNFPNSVTTTPPKSTTRMATSFKTVYQAESNRTTKSSDFTTTSIAESTTKGSSTITWIAIGAASGFVFVVVVTVAAVVTICVIRRHRKRQVPQITYPSNEVHRFNIPIDPNSKIADHGITLNGYMAVVPAFPEEIKEFEMAAPVRKDKMYDGFVERIKVAERIEQQGVSN
uniref:Transmembrane protein n=1 Tax=Panagrellus redivivus TaxID=6233 RepID=A0A7E4VQR7_PANRE